MASANLERRPHSFARRGGSSTAGAIESEARCSGFARIEAGISDRLSWACDWKACIDPFHVRSRKRWERDPGKLTPGPVSIEAVKKHTISANSEALSTDFLDFIIELNKHHVDFVLIGGYAMGVHGVVRATGDIDFLYRRTRPNMRRLCAAMEKFGAPPEVIDETALMTPDIVTQFGIPPNRIDLLNTIDGVTFRQVWAGSTSATIQGQKLCVIGLAELKANKTATGRIRDADDVRRLQARKPRNKK